MAALLRDVGGSDYSSGVHVHNTTRSASVVHMHIENRTLRPIDPSAPAPSWLHPDDRASRDRHGNAIPSGLIYRFYNADRELLYIGQTTNNHTYPGRWTGHKTSSAWWGLVAYYSVDRVPSDPATLAALEKAAIRSERPRFNKQYAKSAASFKVLASEGPAAIVEQLRTHLLPEDFTELVRVLKAEPDV